ncbi:MAG: 1-deoxy-D-xylulose-5-phosphate synthase [candidate division Zixibacteria bacterium SM1_73]|nr:MAG: 1-deoxy-D-xylulose-5-phosphate synthase [candidate division Zixibacteria bacterium SM1_73]
MKRWLDQIDSPEDLKSIPIENLKELAEEIREKIITVVSKNGGHLAPNLGAVELTLALHYVFDSPKDKIIWDVGHQCYTHKLLTGRKDRFGSLRKHEGISGFPKKCESEHDVFDVGHASTSISTALGVACARNHKEENFFVVAVVGDGALTGGLSFEGLNNSGALGKNLIVILNDNKMSISKNVGAMSKYLTDLLTDEKYNKLKAEVWELVGRFKRRDKIRAAVAKVEESVKGFLVPGILFEKLGFRYFGPLDGHDIAGLIKTLEHLKTLNRPILLHILTKKGKGYKFAEEDAPRFHGIGAFDKVTGNSNGQIGKTTYTDIFGSTIVKLAQNDEKIVALTAAMTLGTGLVDFARIFPERFYDVGIAEQHGTTFGSGLASQGLKPIFAVYSTFLQRAFDQVIHDVALQNLPLILAIDRAGLVGEDGPTHHGTFDLSYLRQIPNWVVMAPKDGNELKNMLYTAVRWQNGPVAIRYPRGPIPDDPTCGDPVEPTHDFTSIEMGSWERSRKGKDLAILAVGSMVYPALEAAEQLKKDGIDVEVVNARFVKPLDEAMLLSVLKGYDKIITVEENALLGGFGSAILEFAEAHGIKNVLIKRMGIPDKFIEHGSRKKLLSVLALDRDGIIQMVRNILELKHSKIASATLR